jgi:hypothetical protein
MLQGTASTLGVFIPFGEDVDDVYRSPVDHGTRCNEPTRKGVKLPDRAGRGNLPVVRNEA